MRVCALAALASCSVTAGTDAPSVDGSAVGPGSELESACSLRGIASLAGGFISLFGAGDAEAVSAILAPDEDFLWFSDGSVQPRVSIDDRDDAVDFIALEGSVTYQLLQIHISLRADELTADVVFPPPEGLGGATPPREGSGPMLTSEGHELDYRLLWSCGRSEAL